MTHEELEAQACRIAARCLPGDVWRSILTMELKLGFALARDPDYPGDPFASYRATRSVAKKFGKIK